jgi:hypothetical protein
MKPTPLSRPCIAARFGYVGCLEARGPARKSRRGLCQPLGCFTTKLIMKAFIKRIYIATVVIAITNLLLFAIVGSIIGGNANYGKVENGHYYLANHGKLTEVSYFVFRYSQIHAATVLVTFLLMILVVGTGNLILSGETRPRPKTLAVTTSDSTSEAFEIIQLLFWKIADLFEEAIWIVMDSWRKPDFELFVRRSQQECIRELKSATDNKPELYNLRKPIWGYFSGQHFNLQKWNSYPLYIRDGGIRPVLSGKFSFTPQGTYIRLWHRFTSIGTLFITAFLGTVLSGLSLFITAIALYSIPQQTNSDSTLRTFAFLIAPLFYISTMLISIRIGSALGKKNNIDILEFVKNVLETRYTSKQGSESR